MIVDLEPSGKAGHRGPLMALAVAVLAVAFGALLLRPPDPDSAARARARVLAVLPPPTATASPTASAPRARSVLAQRTPRPALPPLLTLPQDVAASAGTDALREVQFSVSETSRPIVYRLADGRMFVIQQTIAGRGRPMLPTAGLEEGTVRGRPAQYLSTNRGRVRALLWWEEWPVSYYLYSSTLTIRELVRLSDELR